MKRDRAIIIFRCLISLLHARSSRREGQGGLPTAGGGQPQARRPQPDRSVQHQEPAREGLHARGAQGACAWAQHGVICARNACLMQSLRVFRDCHAPWWSAWHGADRRERKSEPLSSSRCPHFTIPLACLQEAGIPVKFAPTIGISVDHRRKNRSLEGLQASQLGAGLSALSRVISLPLMTGSDPLCGFVQANVNRLKAYRSNLVILPRNAKKPKKFEASAADAKTVSQSNAKTIMPIVATKPALEVVKVTADMKVRMCSWIGRACAHDGANGDHCPPSNLASRRPARTAS